jgi:1-acyl-sn-glycerol-3-phosphate acyltransferase
MQNVVLDRPYVFVPPSRGTWWPWLLQSFLPWRLRARYGIESTTFLGAEKLAASLRAGHGVLVAPNHCRPCDPEVVHALCRRAGTQPYMMASWHLFMHSRVQCFLLRSTGTFSIYREGTDRHAVATAVELLERGGRPLVIFPEGVQTRTNDRLNPLLEGAAAIARLAARNRAKHGVEPGVVVHPVALRYRYGGDVARTVGPVLTEIEERISWKPQSHLALEARVAKLGSALLALKEIEVFDSPQDGPLAERLRRLIDGLLVPLEQEWLDGARGPHVVGRVKALRAAVLHDMLHDELPETERARRWDQMADMYLAQSISFYPPDYVGLRATPERILETVERLEEDLTDVCRRHAPLHVTVTVGDAIEVPTARDRDAEEDPVTAAIETELKRLLEIA